jgi:hypothetical protein
MRRDKDIIGYMYNDTEEQIRTKIAVKLLHHHMISCYLPECNCNDSLCIIMDIPANELGYYPDYILDQMIKTVKELA